MTPRVLFIISLLTAGQSHAETLTLADYLEQVQSANVQATASSFRADAAKARVREVGTWADPFLAIGPDEIPFDGMGYVIRYQLSQSIPFPGKLGAREDSQSARAQGVEAETNTLRRQLTLTAVERFFLLLYTERAIELNRANAEAMNDLVESTRSRYETGSGTHHEWLLATIETNTLKTERLRLERERDAVIANLNELRFAPLDRPIEPVALPEDEIPAWAESVTDALGRQPEFVGFQANLRAADADLRGARLGYLPDFVVQGMVMQSRMAEEPSNYGIMLGATLPLFAWRRQGGAFDAAKYEQHALTLNQQALALRLRAEWYEAERVYQSARDTVELYRSTVLPTTELALKASQAAYAARTATLADYINVLRASRSQKLEYLAARLDLHMAVWRKKQLLAAPPITRFTPQTPTLFGSGGMGGGGMPPGGMPRDTGMGRGMPVPKGNEPMEKPSSPGGGMKGM